MKLKELPKIELHLHIDGSLRPSTVAELSGISLEEVEKRMICDKKIHSLTNYLEKFDLPIQVMQKKENLKRVTRELLEDLKEDYVIYAELRFAPQFHTKEGLNQEEVVEYVLSAMKEVTGIKSNLILCCMRHDIETGNKNNLETIEVARKYQKEGVCLDLAGDEAKYPTILFEDLFLKMQEYGIPYTIHAGEAADYHSVEAAICFGTKRIGHGVQAIASESLLKKIREEEITLEVCPDSNVDTEVVSDKKFHPIKELFSKVSVTLNTDNRTVSKITLTEEYEDLMKLFHFTIEDFKKMNENAIKAAFLNEKEKKELLKVIEEGYHDSTY